MSQWHTAHLHCRQSLWLVRVEVQTVLEVPVSDVGTPGKNRQSYSGVVGTHGKMELCVIGVLVIMNTVVITDHGVHYHQYQYVDDTQLHLAMSAYNTAAVDSKQ